MELEIRDGIRNLTVENEHDDIYSINMALDNNDLVKIVMFDSELNALAEIINKKINKEEE